MTQHTTPVIIEPENTHKASVIWLHGLGADGHDFAPVIPQLNLAESLGIRFIFPHAPVRNVTMNQNMPMRAWFNLHSLELRDTQDFDINGILESKNYIDQLIKNEVEQSIPATKILLAGFSQGGCLALLNGLTYPETLAGILALSTYLPPEVKWQINPANKKTPIMMAHGDFDPVLPLKMGQITYEHLHQQNLNVAWHQYPMAHEVCRQEITDISQWLTKLLT